MELLELGNDYVVDYYDYTMFVFTSSNMLALHLGRKRLPKFLQLLTKASKVTKFPTELSINFDSFEIAVEPINNDLFVINFVMPCITSAIQLNKKQLQNFIFHFLPQEENQSLKNLLKDIRSM